MPAHDTWESTDVRDSGFHREYSLVSFDDLSALRGGHFAILFALAIPHGRVSDAVVVDRIRSVNVREDARNLVAMLSGFDGPDRDRARNLRNRVDLIRRDHGDVALTFAVYYGERLPTQARVLPTPTDAMLARTADELLHQGGYGGHYWNMALRLEELPEPPHPRCVLAVVGIDSRGRVEGSLPRPNHHQLDRWFRRDLRQLVQAVIEHTTFRETVKAADAKGLTLAFLWRYENARRVAA